MGHAAHCLPPLLETGNAPRYLVTGAERLERVSAGLFCFALTRSLIVNRANIRRVELYLDCTPAAMAESVGLIWQTTPELIGIPKIWSVGRH